MRKIDEKAVRDYSLTIARLMESAGEKVVEALEDFSKPLSKKTVGVLCGKGHNGGDALATARILKRKKIKVLAVIVGKPADFSEETLKQFRKAKTAGVSFFMFSKMEDLKATLEVLKKCDIVLDGLLGTGLSRPVTGFYREVIRTAAGLHKSVVAIDIPSGMSADSGEPLGEVLPAQMTVTFGLPKIGFYMPRGMALTGQVRVMNIGFPQELLNASFIQQELTGLSQVRDLMPQYDENTYKGTRGRVLVVAGSTGLTGAAALCAYGAQRIGAGLVTVACPKSLNNILEVKLTEPMTVPVEEVKGGFFSPNAAAKILNLAARADSIVIGPGIGRHPQTGQLLQNLLSKITIPMVVDADGLYLLGGRLGRLKSWRAPAILTPHPGEAAGLLKTTIAQVQHDRVNVAKHIARVYNIVVVLKGHYTVIAHPKGMVQINPTGNRGLATGGTGDVLSGILGGLLAQGLSAFEAAIAGVYLHGLAGEKASQRLGLDGLLAGDLLPLLPRLLRQVRSTHREPLWPSQSNSKTNGKRS